MENNIFYRESDMELQRRLSDSYRRVWIYYSRLNTVQMILFPNDRLVGYRIVTRQRANDLWLRILVPGTGPGTEIEAEYERIMNVDMLERAVREEIP